MYVLQSGVQLLASAEGQNRNMNQPTIQHNKLLTS
jgi:hypothetical protein